MMRQGYASFEYAQSFGGNQAVLALPDCGGHLLVRAVPDTGFKDASGCYPFFSCTNWPAFASGIAGLPHDLLTVSMVLSPFCTLSEGKIGALFEAVRPLGEHYLIDLGAGAAPRPAKHHRRKLREARPGVEIAPIAEPAAALEDWVALYNVLVEKHSIKGIRRFSHAIFAKQLQVPGALLIGARKEGRLLGIDWYYQEADHVFAHLSAYSDEGYALSISYPMMAAAIDHFQGRASVIDLGGAPRLGAAKGIADFKSGWATRTAPAYFCGKAPRLNDYLAMNGSIPPEEESFFPFYRRGDY
jgi:Acetyltransferase (GNAT) domain